ncbi:hypothetical protein Btru_034847 [Bulinus truncatus]|nr:hypothetical protein Btru_034847 [Bulinus truncatus]
MGSVIYWMHISWLSHIETDRQTERRTMTSCFYQLWTSCFLASLTLTYSSVTEESQILYTQRRDIMDLCNVVTTYTRWNCLNLLGYGCYCGLGGKGKPLDGIDRCCQVHDGCYEEKGVGCNTYFVDNKFECRDNRCECKDSPTSGCAYDICRCDVQFGECLISEVFNQSNANHNKKLCF